MVIEDEWVQTTSIRKAPSIQFRGQEFVVVVQGEIKRDTLCATLRVKHKHLNTLNTTDFFEWGFSPESLRQELAKEEIKRSVVECDNYGHWPDKRGREYLWLPEVRMHGDGGIDIIITVGYPPGAVAKAFNFALPK